METEDGATAGLGTETLGCLARLEAAFVLGLSIAGSVPLTDPGPGVEIEMNTIYCRVKGEPWMQPLNYDTAYLFRRGLALGARLACHGIVEPSPVMCLCEVGPTASFAHQLCKACSSAFMSLVNDRNAVIESETIKSHNTDTLQCFRDRCARPGVEFPKIHCAGPLVVSHGVTALPVHVWALFSHIVACMPPETSHTEAQRVIRHAITTGVSMAAPKVLQMVATAAITLHVLAAVKHTVPKIMASLGEDPHPFVAWNHCMILLSAATVVFVEPIQGPPPADNFECHVIIQRSTFDLPIPTTIPLLGGFFFDTEFVFASFKGVVAQPFPPHREFHLCRELIMFAHGEHLQPGMETIHRHAEELCKLGFSAPGHVLELPLQPTKDTDTVPEHSTTEAPAGAGSGTGTVVKAESQTLTTHWIHEIAWG
jgi:hypothetical protein